MKTSVTLLCDDVARERGEPIHPDDARGFSYLPDTCCSSCHEDGDRFDTELIDGRTASVCCWQLDRMAEAGQRLLD